MTAKKLRLFFRELLYTSAPNQDPKNEITTKLKPENDLTKRDGKRYKEKETGCWARN